MKIKPQNNDSIWGLMALAVLLLLGTLVAMIVTNWVWLVAGVPLALILLLYAVWKGGQ
ncbi:hypothetical protein [Anthocerotibacter panamensis]|uniref:hypothetical protein n=1 Tax=Anthocerotibacter panamensis TaxID=2857077 RepID=UPI001C4045FD|nr:hypothetical protein [Anthocerotibacter panamensis]